ncbi:MAG: SecY-interacting protein [Pseudomonadales bacterium]
MSVKAQLESLVARCLALARDGLLASPYDADWRSDCEVYQSAGNTWWRPVAQRPQVNFSGIENALEAPLHPDLIAYYSTYWAGTLETDSSEGRVSLIQLWNQDDFERLRGNLLGHALMKQRRKQPLTIFFANTEPESELFLSLDNQSGQVLLEEAGRPPLRVVASGLAEFLARLAPAKRQSDLY